MLKISLMCFCEMIASVPSFSLLKKVLKWELSLLGGSVDELLCPI